VPEGGVGQLILGHEGRRAAANDVARGRGFRVARGEHDARPPGQRGELLRERDAVAIGEADIDEGGGRLQRIRESDRLGNRRRLARHGEVERRQQALRDASERGVVIDDENLI